MLFRKPSFAILLFAIAFLRAPGAYSENTRNAIRYSTQDGLPDNSINCISQDSHGFIWVASRSGVSRFDGYRFKTFKLGSSANVLFPHKDTIWIGTDKGLYLYDCISETISNYDDETEYNVTISSPVTGICRNKEGDMLIATDGQGLFIADQKNGKLIQKSRHASMISQLKHLDNDHVLIGGEEGIIIETDSMGEYVRTIYKDKTGPELKNTIITSLLQTKDGILAGIENKGLFLIGDDGNILQLTPQGNLFKKPFYVFDLQNIKNGKVLIGTLHGLASLNLNSKTFSEATDESGKPMQVRFTVNDIFIDKENNKWIATQNDGIYCFPESSMHERSLLSDSDDGSSDSEIVTALCAGPDDQIWIGTEGGSIYSLKSDDESPQKASVSFNAIKCLFAENDILWIGTTYDGLYQWHILTGKVSNYRHDRYDITTISDNCVNSIARDSEGKLYIGTEWGLNYFDESSQEFSYEPRSTNMSSVSKIFEDSQDSVWILTHNSGIFRVGINGKGWRRMQYRDPKTRTVILTEFNDVVEDKSGNIWLGTSSGLLRYDSPSKSLVHPDFNGLVEYNKNIYSLEFDNHGDIWASNPKGIYRIDISKNEITSTLESSDLVYENHYLEKSSVKRSNGELLFGGVNGITAFNPSVVKENIRTAPLYITGVLVNNERIKIKDKINLKRQENNVTFEYALLSYRNPNKNHYRYKLKGYDDDWSEDTPTTSVSFLNLKPGNYTFCIVATNSGSYSHSSEADIHFKVRRSTLLSWPAILAYCFICSIILYFFILQDKKNKYNRNIADKLNFLTDFTHEIRTSVTLIKTPLDKIVKSWEGSVQNKRNLIEVEKGIDSLMDHLNQTLDYRKMQDSGWVIDKKFCNVHLLLDGSVSKFRLLAEANNVSIKFDKTGEDALYEVDPYMLTKIIDNLLSNAVKYAEKLVSVSLEMYQTGFRITVFDDGPTIKESEQEQIFRIFYQAKDSKAGTGIGLALAKKLTEEHGGTISVLPSADGACFQVDIPAEIKENIDITDISKAESAKEPETPGNDIERYSILIVDDNEDLRIMIAEILKDRYTVYQAGDGKSALQILENVAVDLILSDIIMPEMNGVDFCRAVKSDKRYSHIPLILISAKSDMEDKLAGLESGADDYIEKPFSPDFMLAKISTLLSNRKKLEAFYSNLPDVHPKKISTFSKEDIDFIERLNKALEKNIKNSQFHIGDIAEEMYLSQSTFYRKIKTLFKISPNEYVKQFRLQKAAEMLSRGENTVNFVCFEVGFSSISYFSSCFKKRFGQSPTKYLASVKAKADSIKA